MPSRADLAAQVAVMTDALAHRGPDDSGLWCDAEAGIGLGFRRLAILDLTPAGHQPMRSPGGRYVIVFNGEVYNHRELREHLIAAGIQFRGHSDTEVAAAAFERWGIRGALQRFEGMFAFGIWDTQERQLTLARDRIGKKPLYVHVSGGRVLFASELKAFFALRDFRRDVDPEVAAQYLRRLTVPEPRAILRDTFKVGAGQYVTFPDALGPTPEPTTYWSIEDVAVEGQREPLALDVYQATTSLETLLDDSVRKRVLESDVPVGGLLSGGIDSTLVVALAVRHAPRSFSTFTIGYPEAEFDESRHAATVARHLGTQHHTLHVTHDDVLGVVSRLPSVFDEPFADPSQCVALLISEYARRHVTVAISGDGGDELFAGYNRYIRGEQLANTLDRLPRNVRRALASVLTSVSPAAASTLSSLVRPLLPSALRGPGLPDRLGKVARLLRQDSRAEMYRSLVSAWESHGPASDDVIGRVLADERFPGLIERMMLADQKTYLVEDGMTKMDRASSAVALELRMPLLDHRIIEFAWSLPRHLRVRNGQGKWLLRRVLRRHVPERLFDRPKMGFSVPIVRWLSGPLREWAEWLLDPAVLRADPVLDGMAVRQSWERMLAGHTGEGNRVWAVLMLRAWQERWATLPVTAPVSMMASQAAPTSLVGKLGRAAHDGAIVALQVGAIAAMA